MKPIQVLEKGNAIKAPHLGNYDGPFYCPGKIGR